MNILMWLMDIFWAHMRAMRCIGLSKPQDKVYHKTF